MHVAILTIHTDGSAFAQAWPRDGDKFVALIEALRPAWGFSIFAVKDGVFPADLVAFDGFIITGSPAGVHDDAPWVATMLAQKRQIADLRIPMFGACFGHQAIAMALGGTVGANPGGWGLGRVDTSMNGTPMMLYAAHREQVFALPHGARALGGNAACPIGSFALGHTILATQYHPEMTPEIVAALVEHLDDALPGPVIAKARASLDYPAETGRMAQVIVDFPERASYESLASKSIAVT